MPPISSNGTAGVCHNYSTTKSPYSYHDPADQADVVIAIKKSIISIIKNRDPEEYFDYPVCQQEARFPVISGNSTSPHSHSTISPSGISYSAPTTATIKDVINIGTDMISRCFMEEFEIAAIREVIKLKLRDSIIKILTEFEVENVVRK
jgi:hypothetical protein